MTQICELGSYVQVSLTGSSEPKENQTDLYMYQPTYLGHLYSLVWCNSLSRIDLVLCVNGSLINFLNFKKCFLVALLGGM